MLSYVLRRLFYAAITFLGITIVVFTLIHAVPGDPVDFYIGLGGIRPPVEVIEQIRREYQLDQPLAGQYLHWLRRAVTLDFGRSIADRDLVTHRIGKRVSNTVVLNLLALLI